MPSATLDARASPKAARGTDPCCRKLRTAWLFPGHGSQYRGMGRGFPFDSLGVRAVFDEAEALSGLPLRRASESADTRTLRDPVLLEPLLAAFALACVALLEAQGRQPDAVLGYSAGMLPALHCAGVIDQTSTLRLAVRRGHALKAMASGCAGGMGSAIGLTAAALAAALTRLGDRVDVAGWNAPDHMTLAADDASLKRAAIAVQSAGGVWYPIEVGAAWHSARAAAVAFHAESVCDGIEFAEPVVPFYCSVHGRREADPRRLRTTMVEHLFRPVLWHASISALRCGERIDDFIEVGCGRALQGMTRRATGHDPSASNRFHPVHG